MKKEEYLCDIKGCSNHAQNKQVNMQVIFTTEQTEGRSVTPYLSMEKLDLCNSCKEAIVHSGKYIQADGAQGYNNYYLQR